MAKKTRSQARLKRHLRVRKKISGTAEKPRLNVFRSLTDIYAQVVDDIAGKTIVSASSIDKELRKEMKGKAKSEQARIVGEAVAKRAKAQGINAVVFDRGGFRFSGRVKALADGAREEGLKF
ncbi:MAG: 50S ribosomal protein L18 [Chloroflexi bacterium]|nr:50S ribosomal protein L18 [Chloroflexota bacterium]MQC26485.1 50S ribosomal protein L18 [Chloroflexota bacterium]